MRLVVGGSTPHQRLAIRCVLARNDLPTDRVTVMHRDLFQRANVPWREGRDLDGELCAMTKAQASRLLDKLRERAS